MHLVEELEDLRAPEGESVSSVGRRQYSPAENRSMRPAIAQWSISYN